MAILKNLLRSRDVLVKTMPKLELNMCAILSKIVAVFLVWILYLGLNSNAQQNLKCKSLHSIDTELIIEVLHA